MKITMYDLLGMVKDGKAPKKIKYQNVIYIYYERLDDMFNYKSDDKRHRFLEEDYYIENILNDTVEILEEEKKIPEKLDLQYKDIIYNPNFKEEILMYCDNLQFKINEILDYLKSKGE